MASPALLGWGLSVRLRPLLPVKFATRGCRTEAPVLPGNAVTTSHVIALTAVMLEAATCDMTWHSRYWHHIHRNTVP